MGRPVNYDLLRVRDALRQQIGAGVDLRPVPLPSDDEHGNPDLGKPLHSGRVRRALVAQGCFVLQGDQVHLPNEVAHGGVHQLRSAVVSIDPDPDLELGHPLQISGLVGLNQLLPLAWGLLVGLEPAHGGADQHEDAARPG